MTPLLVVWVALAGGIGAVVRHLATSLPPSGWAPWPVCAVNVVGSAIAGFAAAWLQAAHPDAALIVITGFCGGLTTFSTFAVETVQLQRDGRMRQAALHVALTFALGIGACALAAAVGAALVAS